MLLKVCCEYGNIGIGIPVFMANKLAGDAEETRKGSRNCTKIKTMFEYGLKKTRIMVVTIRKEELEQIDERVQQHTVLKTNSYKYLGIALNAGGLKDHIYKRWGENQTKYY